MKMYKLTALITVLLLASVSARVWADQAGDDLVLCCAPQGVSADIVGDGSAYRPQVRDCVALDGSVKSMNRCSGFLVGCSEHAFSCEPAADGSPGKKDCFCAIPGVASAPPGQLN